jgi:predicted Zn-dependent peptidase
VHSVSRLLGLALAALALAASTAKAQDRFDVRQLSFPSGLTAVIAKAPVTPETRGRVYVGAYVGFGSMDEPALGLAHLLEHVVATSPSAIQGAPAMPGTAKSYNGNAATKPNYTSFMRIVSPDGMEASIYARLARLHTTDDAAVFEREKTRVVQELERSSPQLSAYKALEALAKGWSPRLADEVSSVQAAPQADVRTLIDRAYAPSRTVLVVAGDLDPDRASEQVKAAVRFFRLDTAAPEAPAPPKRALRFDAKPMAVAQNAPQAFAAGVAFRQPPRGGRDLLPFLVLDQLLLGGRDNRVSPTTISRSDTAPLPARLNRSLAASAFWDGKEGQWGIPAFAQGDPSLYAILFTTPGTVAPQEVLTQTRAALRDIRAQAMSDTQIVAAREALADFYGRWLLEPDFRILADHLAAIAFAKQDPASLDRLGDDIRAVRPSDVRRVMDRYLIAAPALAVVTAPRGQ